MTYLAAQTIHARVISGDLVISPYHPESKRLHGRSFGLTCCGYDVRLRRTVWVWPGFGRLASIMEFLHLPNDIVAEVKDKSTNARKFVAVQNTVIEPGWFGVLTLEITRHRPWPIRLRVGTPIAQIMFHRLDEATVRPYSGKYQGQGPGPVAAILED